MSKNGLSAQGITLNGESVISSSALMLVSEQDSVYVKEHFPFISAASAKGGTAPNEWIDVHVNLGDFSANNAPTVTLTPPDTLVARNVLSFTASASDADGDDLAYQWDFGDGVIHSSSATINHTWIVGENYTVKVTVSDMKGKTATDQVTLVVTDPLTEWADRTSNTTNNLNDIASNGSMVLAVGKPVLKSTDGETWTQLNDKLGTNVILSGIVHDGTQWIAVGQDYDFGTSAWVGIIYTSTDGSTWVQRYKGGKELEKIAFEDGGPNDADGKANGAIEDPVAVSEVSAATTSTPIAATSSSGGGGAISLYWPLLVGLLVIIRRRVLRKV